MSQELLNVGQDKSILLAGEGNRFTLHAGAARTADAMYVVFRIIREGVIDHVAHALDMKTATCNVGSDQHGHLPGLEALEGFYPLGLRHIA